MPEDATADSGAVLGDDAGIRLIEHCIDFAQVHGVPHLIELLAAIHLGLSAEGDRMVIRAAYETAGVSVPDGNAISFEIYTLQ